MSYEEFLNLLSPDRIRAEERFVTIQAKLVSFFTWNNCPDPINCAAVTIDRVVNATPPEDLRNIEAWIFGFARNVKRENVRPTPVVFGIEIDAGAPVEKDAESAETEERWYADMRSCLERLTDSERRLIVRYFTNPNGISRAEHRAQISGELGVTVNALRIRITKIKSLLTKYRQQPAGPRRDLVSKNRN